MSRRRYSDQDRAEALAALEANAGNVKQTARQLGIPETTLRQWMEGKCHPQVAQLSAEKRGPLADRLEGLIHALLDDMARPEKIQGADLRMVATALGIAVDKMQLLRGKPTNIDGRELTDAERVDRLNALYDRLRARGVGLPLGGQN